MLRTEGATIKFGGLTAVNQVDMHVKKGDVCALIGPNGAGKTTCFNILSGVYRPTSGKVYLLGEDTTGQTVAQMSRKCGYVFQNPNHQIFCTTVEEEPPSRL